MAYNPVHNDGFHTDPIYSISSEHDQYPLTGQEHVVSSESQPVSRGEAQKPYADIELQEMNQYWTTPSYIPSAPSHQRGWSGSTISAETPPTKRKHKSNSAPSSLKKTPWLRRGGPWTLEVITILISCGAIASIMGVLARFNGHALPEWPYYITLNALIALLATVATSTMSISLQNGLSQLKWIRFKESSAPLTDMEAFDEASRGTWGALKLLATARGGFLGSFGAIVAIIALALGPFAQQVVTYQSRSVESDEGANVNRALNYTGALPGNNTSTGFVPVLPLKSAVYNGLFAENGRPGAALSFECRSGNCTWDPYETLGVCHECVDLTPFIEQYCPTGAKHQDCGWQVRQGAKLSSNLEVFSMTSQIPTAYGDLPHSMIMKLIFMGTEAYDGTPGEIKPWARQCTLSACLQTLESAVTNGALSENVTDTYVNTTVLDISNMNSDRDRNIYVVSSNGTAYVLGIEAMLAMRGWFSSLFATGSAIRNAEDFNRTITNNTVVVNLTVGISSGETFFDSDIVTAFYWNYYEYANGLDMLMSDMATSMTVAFRSFIGAELVSGRTISVESYVHVRWGFAVLPIVVVVGTALFLAGAIYRARKSHTQVWKSSALAMLFHGLEDDVRIQFAQDDGLHEQKRQAKCVKVQLDESGENVSLLRA
ncbi:hypothetical protein F4779DRAFT_628306 [Xylariaceae sp. FL0662B]|nr:hypothetical protein F4779DRAFT_628306 [Xylariaceae sp. FL0662B]